MYQLKSDDSTFLNQALRAQVVAFNKQHFEAERHDIGFKFVTAEQQLIAGIHGQVFGNWLLISWLWCDTSARGQGLAQRLLVELENKAVSMGASKSQLDTLDFQAKPFYEKNGYQVKYTMTGYPLTGERYYMEKVL